MGFKRLDTSINPLLRTITLEFGPFDSNLFDFWFCAVHVDQLFESCLRRLMEVPSLLAWLERRGVATSDFVFPSRIAHANHMSTRQYARLVDEWVTAIGLRRAEYGTHSMRRTKAAMIYRATGNIRAIQILLGHTKIENTVRYVGFDVEDALLLAERTEI